MQGASFLMIGLLIDVPSNQKTEEADEVQKILGNVHYHHQNDDLLRPSRVEEASLAETMKVRNNTVRIILSTSRKLSYRYNYNRRFKLRPGGNVNVQATDPPLKPQRPIPPRPLPRVAGEPKAESNRKIRKA